MEALRGDCGAMGTSFFAWFTPQASIMLKSFEAMNRLTKNGPPETPSRLMGTLSIMGFAAEGNLREVARALGKRDLGELKKVAEKNAKQVRLRAEIEEQVGIERKRSPLGLREKRKLSLTSKIALMFEKMGAQTVEIAELCRQVIQDPKPSRVTEIKKLIEHAVYITDRAVTGFVEEDIHMAKIAREQSLAAATLHEQIKAELSSLMEAKTDAASRSALLSRVTDKTQSIIAESRLLTEEVINFLESVEL